MNIPLFRNFIYLNFALVNVVSPSISSGLQTVELNSQLEIGDEFIQISSDSKKQIRLNEIKISNDLEINQKSSSKNFPSKRKQLEIQSDEQFQENNIIYANGNVIVTYRGNVLKADSFIYDQLNETIQAEGDIKLTLGDQIFNAEKIEYDFKEKKGFFSKVKGLVKTKNLSKNLDLNSYESNEIASVVKLIKQKKVLHTPDGVNNWIFYTDKLTVDNNKWFSQKAIFTNDLLETNQVKFEINSLKIFPQKDVLKLKTAISYLIFEDNLPIPFWFGTRTLNKSKEGYIFDFGSKWYVGLDELEKDGFYLGRKFEPIDISDNFVLDFEPQFLLQRSIQGYTNSYVKKDDSITADKARRDTSLSDYFGMNSDLNGKINNWDLTVKNQLTSLDISKFLDALRVSVDLTKEIDLFNSRWNKSFYGVYRDRIWNGSIGEAEIYIGYGLKIDKTNTWEKDGIKKTEKISIGMGEFKGEELNGKNLVESYKGSIFYSLDQKFPLLVRENKDKFVDNSFNYIFEPINQGIYINTKLSALYSFYENGNHQEFIGYGLGPEFTLGEFKKKYFDYTRVSISPFYRLKNGESLFKFDQISDQFTLDIALDQQIYGPILLKSNATLNLDGNSKDYGDFINSNISINWKKRTYEFAIYYQPHIKRGGINFALYGFE